MSQKPNHFRIGLFVLGGVALLLVALFVFGIRSSFEKRHRLVTYVPGDVEGLAVGSPVKLKGVAVGQVTGLYFAWNRYPGTKTPCVIVEFEMKDAVSPVPIPKNGDVDAIVRQNVENGLRVIVKSQGITGTSFLELELLDPAKNPPFAYDWPAPRYPYVPSAPTEVGQLLASVKRTLSNLEKLDTARIGAQIESTLAAAEAAAKRIAEFDAGGVSASATRTIRSADAAVAEIQGLAKDARAKVQQIPVEGIGQDLRALLAGLDATNAKIQAAVDRLAGVDVAELNDTLSDLRLAARGLADTLETIKKQPSQLILGSAPPPAGPVAKEERK
jgi:ABC-type transporter Mla subunit MlaD